MTGFNVTLHSLQTWLLGAALTLTGCGDDALDPGESGPLSTTSGDFDPDPGLGTAMTGAETTGEDTAVDHELALWPAAYQEFVQRHGGSRFVEVRGARMHYVESGPADGPPVLLIHGIPTHSYLWREVMPELKDKRVIAVDLLGYGRSARPKQLSYTPQMQVEYLRDFVQALDLQGVHLVTHDLGGLVGLRWAYENSARVASLTMFETLWVGLPSIASVPGPFGELLAGMRSPELGPVLVGDQDVFLSMIGAFTVQGLEPRDADVYRYPWPDAADRVAVFLPSGPLAFPFADESPEAHQFVQAYHDFLARSSVPKLVFDVSPGTMSAVAVTSDDHGRERLPDYAARVFPNTALQRLEGGGHFVQEDLGPELGRAINDFIDGIGSD